MGIARWGLRDAQKKEVYAVRRCDLQMLYSDANEQIKSQQISWMMTHAKRIPEAIIAARAERW